jgi:alkylated DNA repair dioxygenase AlkB
MVESTLEWQASLFGAEPPSPDPAFGGLRRLQLDECCWIDLCRGWLTGADAVFETVTSTGPFEQRQRWMYDRVVDEPRLVAPWPDETLPEAIDDARRLLSQRYERDFGSVWVNLYRDGRDSVAWHGDRVRHTQATSCVVTISLGAIRRFALRVRDPARRAGRAAHRWWLGPGDLVVMGGRSQHDWEHSVPKMALAGPRVSVTMRHLT